ncbi:hypothetical protein Scep_008550 [Stephania cephalantha]|uniref:Transmembrane protein 19 n=1 Tax=Stephania cephalantha TaxID=152367 RepID=A0AAP0KDP0_9MAGN
MEEIPILRLAASLLISSSIAIGAFYKKSLNLSGAWLGFLVMFVHFFVGYRFGAVLVVFFVTSSALTKYGEEKKRSIDDEFKEGGQRNWIQVLANSGIATILLVILGVLTGMKDQCLDSKQSSYITCLVGGIVGHYACCAGDTWSSEIGMLSKSQPWLITTFKRVRRGTNGAVTTNGILAAAAAGCTIGLTFVLFGLISTSCSFDINLKQLLVVPLATTAGVTGSLIDSLLGATLQFSGICAIRNKTFSYSLEIPSRCTLLVLASSMLTPNDLLLA